MSISNVTSIKRRVVVVAKSQTEETQRPISALSAPNKNRSQSVF